jgi:hypothetical protein
MRPQSQLMVNRRRRRLSCCRSWLTWPGYGVQVCLSCRPPQQPRILYININRLIDAVGLQRGGASKSRRSTQKDNKI